MNRPRITRLPRRLVALSGVLAIVASFGAALAPPASAADSTTLLSGYTGGGEVVAAGGRVFVAGNNRIFFADDRGALTGAITGLSGAVGLAATPDGTRLYAALSGSNEVVEIDTAARTVTRRIDLSAYPCPSHLSLSGSLLWVGYGCGTAWDGGVLGLDPSTSAPEPAVVTSGLNRAPLVAAAGNTLVVGEMGVSPADLMVYDVSAAPAATLRGVIDGHANYLGSLNDLAITPDGSMVVSAFDSPYVYTGWDTTTLTKARTYGAEPTYTGDPQAVAISPDGAYVAGARHSGYYYSMTGPDVTLYDAATTAKGYTADNPVGEIVQGSLTFSGTDVFGVVQEPYNGQSYLWRMAGTTLPASTLTVAAPSAATALEPLTLTGRLTLADGSTPGAQPLVVTRRLPDGTSTALPGTTTTADGTFTISDTPPVGGTIGYDVLWDGNASFRWSTASATVTVAKHPSSLTLSGPASGIAGKQLTFSGVLNPGGPVPAAGTPITVLRTVSNKNGTVTATLPTVVAAGDGSFSFTDIPTAGGQYTYTVRWAGDDAFLSAQASHDVTVRGALG